MDIKTNKIIHSETVDKQEVSLKSPNMEREALRRSLEYLSNKLNITEVVTNASSSISKMLGELMILILMMFTT